MEPMMRIATTTTKTMREAPAEPEALSEAIEAERRTIAHLRERLAGRHDEVDETNLGRSLQRISEYLRLAQAFDEAFAAKDEAIEIWRKYGRKKAILLASFQRAVILHYAEHHEQALEEMTRLIDSLDDETGMYRDVFLEARARCLWEMGCSEDAHRDLAIVLDIRERRGKAQPIESTRELIARMSSNGDRTSKD
jgi:tetratricopeptide (TPR) repeat protein